MPNFETPLTEDQADAVRIMLQLCRKIFAMGTGLGKTYGTLAGFEGVKRRAEGISYQLVVFCSKNSIKIWRSELKSKTYFTNVICTADKNEEYFKALSEYGTVTVCEYTVLDKARHYLSKVFSQSNIVLALDEFHRLKGQDTYRMSLVRPYMTKVVCIWGLTATPVLNHLDDTFNMIDLLFPGALGKKSYFMRRYVKTKLITVRGKKHQVQEGVRNLEMLKREIAPYIFYRYNPMDIRFNYIRVDLTPEEEELYLIAAEGALGNDEREFAGRLPDLQLVADGSVVEGRQIQKDVTRISSKEAALLSTLTTELAQDKPMIVYTCHRPTLYRLTSLLKARFLQNMVYVISGDTPGPERERIEDAFAPGDILLMTGAGGESLNLQASNHVVLFNLTFKVDEFIHLVGRVARMDSEYDHILVSIIEARNTIDYYKCLLLKYHSDKIKKIQAEHSPNLLETESGMAEYELIVKMRKELLWRVQARKKKRLNG